MTGVIVRSSANVEAGAQTRLSTVFHGVWLLALVLFFPQLLSVIPTASLAAILVYTGYKLVNPKYVKRLGLYGKAPIFVYAATVVGIVTTDLLTGVVIGVVFSMLNLLYTFTHFETDLNIDEVNGRADLYLIGAATFVRLPKLIAALDGVPPNIPLHVHLNQLSCIDHAAMEILAGWEQQRAQSGNTLIVEREELTSRYWLSPAKRTRSSAGSLSAVSRGREEAGLGAR